MCLKDFTGRKGLTFSVFGANVFERFYCKVFSLSLVQDHPGPSGEWEFTERMILNCWVKTGCQKSGMACLPILIGLSVASVSVTHGSATR